MTDTPAQHAKAQKKYESSKKGLAVATKAESNPKEIKKRENRNVARHTLLKQGKVHKHDDKDVEHVNGNAMDNRPSNWRVGSQHHNRSYARTSGGHKKNPRS